MLFILTRRTDRYVHILCGGYLLIIPAATLKRARRHVGNGTAPRKPVEAIIDGKRHLFTCKEWAKAEIAGRNYRNFSSRIPQHCQLEISDKVKMCKQLAKLRAARLRVEADARAS